MAIELWLKALERPEADLRCKAADDIALGHHRGVKGLEKTIAPLRAALDQPDQHPTVRLAVARTLIDLDAREAGPSLFAQVQAGRRELREMIEPTLAKWDYQLMRSVWLERLHDQTGSQRGLMLAIQGLAAVGEHQAAGRLLEIVRSDRAPESIRLEAARALGSLRSDGLETDAERLAADTSSSGITLRLAGAELLRRHNSKEAIRLLMRFTSDSEPAVVAVATERLIAVNPDTLLPNVARLLGSTDSKVRSLGVQLLFAKPTEKHIGTLADLLDDVAPEVRVKARRSLVELAAKKEWREPVIAEATRMLASRSWRALEQSILLLTRLDHKPAAGRMVELLTFDRPEVFVTAAWGLRKLAVADSLPGIVRYVENEEREPRFKGYAFEMTDHQLSQLNQFLGEQKYSPADAVLRRFFPRRGGPQGLAWPEARSAAIWASGLIHSRKPDAALTAALEERLNDVNSLPIEDERVRRMAAISLGRTKAMEALPSLRKRCRDHAPPTNQVEVACHWAIEQLTGEAMLPPKTIRKLERDWFLAPRE